jgi:hypothetical protein
MRKLYKIFIAAALILLTFKVNAQNSGFDQLIKSSPADASKLVQAYAEPLFKGFGEGLNSGWNNTAKTKKFLHFDLHVTPANPSQIIAPTFGGAKVDGPVMNINNDNGAKVGSFTMPKGQIGYIPAPNIQLTVGLFKNTDLTIRTTPTIKIGTDAGSVGMIGFGLKHDLIQDFAKKLPKPFDLAIAVNYNRLNYSNTLNVQPDAGTTAAPGQSSDFSNQRIDAHFTGFNVQAILSKKLLFFTPFVAVAYETATTDFGVLGNYPITSSNPTQPNMYVSFANLVSISETSVSGMRADVGFQLNLAIFRIYAAYSPGQYQSVNGGIGLGF